MFLSLSSTISTVLMASAFLRPLLYNAVGAQQPHAGAARIGAPLGGASMGVPCRNSGRVVGCYSAGPASQLGSPGTSGPLTATVIACGRASSAGKPRSAIDTAAAARI